MDVQYQRHTYSNGASLAYRCRQSMVNHGQTGTDEGQSWLTIVKIWLTIVNHGSSNIKYKNKVVYETKFVYFFPPKKFPTTNKKFTAKKSMSLFNLKKHFYIFIHIKI